MGVDFSHLGLSMSHRTFSRLQDRLAASSQLSQLEPGMSHSPRSATDDPLVHLLHAPSVDGEIAPEACLEVSRRIRDLSWQWTKQSETGLRAWAERLAEAMAFAAVRGERFWWIG
jgi:hypothetical protein